MVKKLLKESEQNDVFALKIENESPYKGQYIILIKHFNSEWQDSNMLFRAKLTKNKTIPETYEELEELEYIKIKCITYEERFLPLSEKALDDILIKERSKTKFYPDEYNYLYQYVFQLSLSRKDDYNNLIYLGNYELSTPKEEYYPFVKEAVDLILYRDVIENLLSYYEGLNQKGYLIYDPAHCKKVHEQAAIHMEVLLNYDKIITLNEEKGIKRKNSLTYVGGEDKDPFE